MTDYTPGPWEATANLNDGPYGPSYTIRKDKQTVIAGISGSALHRGAKQTAVNARLIAAAPDLLAALNAIKARIQGVWDHPDLIPFGALSVDMNDDIEGIANIAIAKAKRGAL